MTRVPDAGLSRLALAVLVAGLGILLVAVVWGGAVYPDYDQARQFMSELGATGAVTGPTVNAWGYIPNGALVTVFCLLATWILRSSGLAVVACLLLALNGVGMTAAGVYPCDFECGRSDPSPAARLHDLSSALGYLCGIVGVGLAALWARKSDAPWLAPLGLATLIVSVAGLFAVIAEVELAGLYQRAMEAALGVFMLALGWALTRGLRGRPAARL
jgi:hypothetical membrane protein